MHSRFALAPLVALALGLAAAPARAGQVHDEDITFEQLLRPVRDGFATLALVTIATPESEKRAYPVPGGRGKRCAPYDFIAYRATVERVVRAGADLPALAATASLAIVPANVPDLVDLTHRACVDGVSKSPIWERYAGREPAPGLHLLVVLRWHKDYGWLESVAGGWLDAAELARVEAFLAPPKPAPAP